MTSQNEPRPYIGVWPRGRGSLCGRANQHITMEEDEPLLAPTKSNKRKQWNKTIRDLWHWDIFPFIPARYMLAIMGFLGFVNVYALRINLSMAIIAMVNSSANHSTHLVSNLTCNTHLTSIYMSVQ